MAETKKLERFPPSTNGDKPATPAPLSPSADGTGKDPTTGRFLPGNKCGHGNPHYRRLAANRTAILDAVGPEQVKGLFANLYANALAGDVDAARLILAYAVGKPQLVLDPDRADLEEFRILAESPTIEAAVDLRSKHVVPDFAAAHVALRMAATDDAILAYLRDKLDSLERRKRILLGLDDPEDWLEEEGINADA